jgi:hypothetical protein
MAKSGMNFAHILQALVENILWRDAKLACDSIASVVCRG